MFFSFVFNSQKEKESEVHFNSEIDTLRQINQKLFIALGYNDSAKQNNFDNFVQLYKKYNNSRANIAPEIISVKPMVYIDVNGIPASGDFPSIPKLGIYFIVEFRNGSEPLTVNGLKIRNKLFLDLRQYMMFDEVTINKQVLQIEKEWKEKKPYVNIDWDAYVSDKSKNIHFYPFQKGYIGFVLLEPILSGQSEGGWNLPKTQYLGYGDNSQIPSKVRKYPDFSLFFSDFDLSKLPPRKIRSDFQLFLIANSREYPIQRNKILPVDRVSKYEWENDSFEKMYLRYYAE